MPPCALLCSVGFMCQLAVSSRKEILIFALLNHLASRVYNFLKKRQKQGIDGAQNLESASALVLKRREERGSRGKRMACRQAHEEAGGGGAGASGDGHDHSHGHGHDHSHDVEDPEGMSLFGLIDTSRVRCLNERTPGGALNCLKPWDRRRDLDPRLESEEDDPELIIFVPFTQVVKIKAISVNGGGEGTAPATMKVFINRDDIDFGLAQELPPVQTLEMVRDSGGVEVDYPTKLSKMQNVSDITLFVPENFGADSTVITYLGFKGENTKFRHGVVECVYEAKPMPEDHKTPGDEMSGRTVL